MSRRGRNVLCLALVGSSSLWMAGCPGSASDQGPITQCTTSEQCATGGFCDQAGFCAYPDAGGDGGVVATSDAGATDAGSSLPEVAVSDGSIAAIASGQDYPAGIAIQGTTIIWAASDDPGTILGAPVAGGAITTIAAARANPTNIATDATNVYWIDYGTFDTFGDYNDDGAVLQTALAGGTVTTLATAQPAPSSIAVANGNVYWVNSGETGTDGVVMAEPIGGGTASTLFSAQGTPTTIAVDSHNIYWANGGTFDATSGAYNLDGAVIQAAIGGTTTSTLASAQNYPYGLTIDSAKAYWTNEGTFDSSGNLITQTGTIVAVPIGGGTKTTLAAAQDNPGDTVTGEGELYWLNSGITPPNGSAIGSIVGVSTTAVGATPVTLATNAVSPSGVASSSTGTDVYFTDSGSDGTDGLVLDLKP